MAPGKNDCNKLVTVLGMARSGTSALTGTLGLLGLATPIDDIETTRHNPKGFFESASFLALFDDALAAVGLTETDWAPLPQAWFATREADHFAALGRKLIDQSYRDNSRIVFKNPRASRLYPLVKKIFSRSLFDRHTVHIVRNPVEVALSEQDHHGLSRDGAYLMWLRYVLDAEFHTRGEPRIIVHYNDLLSDWRSVIDLMIGTLKLPLEVSESASTRIGAFLDNTLRHHVATDTDLDLATLTIPWLAPTYDALKRLAEQPNDAEAIDNLNSIRLEVDRAGAAFAPQLSASYVRKYITGDQDALVNARDYVAQPSPREVSFSTPSASTSATTPGQTGETVELLYSEFFGRYPTRAESAVWREKLSGAPDFSTLRSALASAPEGQAHLSQIIRVQYVEHFGRSPTASELTTWLRMIASGTPLVSLRETLTSSREGQAYATILVRRLYLWLMSRDASEDELSVSLDRLKAGASVDALAAELAATPEGASKLRNLRRRSTPRTIASNDRGA